MTYMQNSLVNSLIISFSLLSAVPTCNCGKNYENLSCSGIYTEIKLKVPFSPLISYDTIQTGDTINFNSIVSDSLFGLDTSARFEFSLDQLSLVAEIFKVVFPPSSTIPNLQPVYADFNPLVSDGQIDVYPYGSGIRFRYRRQQTNNFLSGGLEARANGTYIIRFRNENSYYQDKLYHYTDYPCINFPMITSYSAQQNTALFDNYNITSINPLPTYNGFSSISKTDKNFVVITVI